MHVLFQELSFKSAGAAKHNMLKAKPMEQKVGLAEQWTEMEKESTWTLEPWKPWKGDMGRWQRCSSSLWRENLCDQSLDSIQAVQDRLWREAKRAFLVSLC